MARIMRLLDIPRRIEIAKRLTPTTFFIVPSLDVTAITAGIYLAQAEGKFDLSSPWIISAGIVVLLLTGQEFCVFMPNGLRIFIELSKSKPDISKIARLNIQNTRLVGSQTIFQVITILIMAHLAVYGLIAFAVSKLNIGALIAAALLSIFGAVYSETSRSHKRGEMNADGLGILRWARLGYIILFILLAITAILS